MCDRMESMGSSIHNLLKSEYEKRQKKAYDIFLQRKDEIYKRIPRIEQIENEIQLSGLKYNKMLLTKAKSSDNIVSELNSIIERLKEEKNLLLKKYGYSDDYLNPVYYCDICNDTGSIMTDDGSKVCSCYKQQYINLIYNQSNLKLTDTENFDCFDEEYYSNTIDENKYGIKKSPHMQILGIKENCLKFTENFDLSETRNLLFCGPTGTGKTFMSNCIAVELMNRGYTVLYQSSPSLFAAINEYRFKSSKDDAFDSSIYKNIMDVELLIIDDFGTESQTAARYAELLTILDTRLANNHSRPCKTIISTNIDLKKLYEYYDERVVSRIIGNFDMYKFAGDDIRKLKVFSK